jgi:hypothetical protein
MTYMIQIDNLVREATDNEIELIELQVAKSEAEKETIAAKNAARQAVLDKLGLTVDEATALLG